MNDGALGDGDVDESFRGVQLNNTPHTRGYTMKVEQRRPRLQPEDIYALAHKDVSEREALDLFNRGDKTTVTYTHRPSPNKTALWWRLLLGVGGLWMWWVGDPGWGLG